VVRDAGTGGSSSPVDGQPHTYLPYLHVHHTTTSPIEAAVSVCSIKSDK